MKPSFEDSFTRIYRNGKLELVLDRRKVIEKDPGADTPAMVYFTGTNKACSTYWCAVGEGELLKEKAGVHRLTNRQIKWLESLDSELTEFLYKKVS